MSVLDDLELRAGLEARRALGARVMLDWASVRLPMAPRSRARAECARAALVAALELGDEVAVSVLREVLVEGPRVDLRPLLEACEPASHVSLATSIAETVRTLVPDAEAALVVAALLERGGRREAATSEYRRAAHAAEAVGDAERARLARVELTRALLLDANEVEALEVASLLGEADLAKLDARQALVVARASLAATGRYRRAGALDQLRDIIARSPREAPETRASLRTAFAHVDALGAALTEAEADRVRALIATAIERGLGGPALEELELRVAVARAEPIEREARTVRAAQRSEPGRQLVERARAVRDAGAPGPRPLDPTALPAWLALSTIAHLAGRRIAEARACVTELAERDARPDAPLWTALRRALPERALREAAAPLAARWLERAGPAPARGFVDLAAVLERAELVDLAGRALERARRRHEPGARSLAIQHAVRRAWAEYDRGARREARLLLLAARHDASSGTGSRTT